MTHFAMSVGRFHRATDAYLTLHTTGTRGRWENLGAVRQDQLDAVKSLDDYYARDFYFSINAHVTPDRRGSTRTLRYLNACYLDLDSYELTPGHALGRLTQAAAEGIIPSPSVFGLSGRGVWAYWILVDVRDSLIPQRAFPEKIDLYSQVQSGLYEAVMEFGTAVATGRECTRPCARDASPWER